MDYLGQPSTTSKSGSKCSTIDGSHHLCFNSSHNHYCCYADLFCSSYIPFVCSCHNAGIECLSLGHSCVPASRCAECTLLLDSLSSIFHCLLLLLCLFLTDNSCNKGMCFFDSPSLPHRSATLNATCDNCGFNCRTIISMHFFVTQHMKQFNIEHAQSPLMCRFESKLLQHLLSW